MNFKKLTYSFALMALFATRQAHAQPNPTWQLSTQCLHTNEHLFLKGSGFVPGAQILGALLSTAHPPPGYWICNTNADGAGEFCVDITYRTNINLSQPSALQRYSFVASSTNGGGSSEFDFSVWYETENSKYDATSKITGLLLDGQPYNGITVQFSAVPHNHYMIQTAPSPVGPWSFTGPFTDSEATNTNLAWTIDMSLEPQSRPSQMFFRIADQFGPCPCQWNTNQP
jgi:hypothetical protein